MLVWCMYTMMQQYSKFVVVPLPGPDLQNVKSSRSENLYLKHSSKETFTDYGKIKTLKDLG